MGRLVADLLSLSRIELNEHIPPSGRVDLDRAASDVERIRALYRRSGYGVTVSSRIVPLPNGRSDVVFTIVEGGKVAHTICVD